MHVSAVTDTSLLPVFIAALPWATSSSIRPSPTARPRRDGREFCVPTRMGLFALSWRITSLTATTSSCLRVPRRCEGNETRKEESRLCLSCGMVCNSECHTDTDDVVTHRDSAWRSLQALRALDADDVLPDVMIIDLDLPDMKGEDVSRASSLEHLRRSIVPTACLGLTPGAATHARTRHRGLTRC